MRFLVATDAKPVYYASAGGGDARLQMEGLFEERCVEIRDARAGAGAGGFALDREGFVLVSHASAVADFYDDDAIAEVYEAEARKLVAAATGAARIAIFDHTRRAGAPATRQAGRAREPTNVVHNDYTERSGPQRVRDLFAPEEAEALLARRFAIVNLWRAVRHPVRSWPLAVCDATTLAPGDLVAAERRARERTGELALAAFNPAHRWFYFPEMTRDEALLIKTFDSATDGRARWAIHSAFDDPATPADAPPRESIETRAFAFF